MGLGCCLMQVGCIAVGTLFSVLGVNLCCHVENRLTSSVKTDFASPPPPPHALAQLFFGKCSLYVHAFYALDLKSTFIRLLLKLQNCSWERGSMMSRGTSR